jgi:DNA polymerase-1
MPIPKPYTIDFETLKIEDRPRYPPTPVGVSIQVPGRKPKYYAWGHPTKNNCSLEQAKLVLADVWRPENDLLFHNAKFDVDVAQTHMGVGSVKLDPLKVHDTQFLLFLTDPHSLDLGLKQNAANLLRMPPEEQADLKNWLISHQPTLRSEGLLPKGERITDSNFGTYISLGPGDLVGKYAQGDTIRTEKLFRFLLPKVIEAGMSEAYRREQRLMPILLENERVGIRCDVAGLESCLVSSRQSIHTVENWLRKELKAPDVNFGSSSQLAELLNSRGIVTEWSMTETGKRSTSKKNVKPFHYSDQKIFQALGYRSKLSTVIGTYLEPWLSTAAETGGVLHAGWNQTRNDRQAGARTGRLSSSPNFMAVAKSFEDKGDGWTHPAFIKKLPALPEIREFILPDKGQVWGRRDYNQQELRVLAHFEDDALLSAYRLNPRMDVHTFVQTTIKEMFDLDLPRSFIKTLNFGLLYGQGVGSMAEKLSKTTEEVKAIRKSQMGALPGLAALDKIIKQRGRSGQSITTWGGRQYFCEEPREISGRLCTFEYKLLNYLIQGSSADCTKEALIRYHDAGTGDARFIVAVHDEINICFPKKAAKLEMLRLRDAMMSVEFDVPMLSDGEIGPNWGSLADLKEPSPDLSKWSAS